MSAISTAALTHRFAEKRDFRSVSAICPHCGAYSTFGETGALEYVEPGVPDEFLPRDGDSSVLRLEAGKCLACGGLVVGTVLRQQSAEEVAKIIWPTDRWPDAAPHGLECDIKQRYDEARSVLAFSPMSEAVLCRRCLQHVIREKLGIKRKTLFDEIAEAVQSRDLTKNTASALDHIRQIGNWGAHPVEDQSQTIIDVSREDAEYTLQVLELLFQDLYITPKTVSEMNAKIKAKK